MNEPRVELAPLIDTLLGVPRVVVVDDDRIVRRLMGAVLKGASVVECETIAGTVGALAQHGASLVVLDHNLPDGRGLTLAGEIRAAGYTGRVCICSASASKTFDEAVADGTIDGFISKEHLTTQLATETMRSGESRELRHVLRGQDAFLSIALDGLEHLGNQGVVAAQRSLRALVEATCAAISARVTAHLHYGCQPIVLVATRGELHRVRDAIYLRHGALSAFIGLGLRAAIVTTEGRWPHRDDEVHLEPDPIGDTFALRLTTFE